MEEYFFTVIDNFEKEKLLPTNKAYLSRLNWNDWYQYETSFNLFLKFRRQIYSDWGGENFLKGTRTI